MASPAAGPTNLGMAPNVAGLLCYAPCCIGLVFSIAAAIVEKQSRFVRFHAFQSLLFHAAQLVVGLGLFLALTVLGYLSGTLAGLLGMVANVGLFVVSVGATIFLMMKAYNGEEYEIPTLGPMARGWV